MTDAPVIRTPAPGELLDAWDAGSSLDRQRRSGPLLRAVTGLDADTLDELGVGERDRVLLRVRERLFGHRLRAVADCPSCGLGLELELTTSTLLGRGHGPKLIEMDVADHHLTCRVPTTSDLADAARAGSPGAARAILIARAIVSSERDGQAVPAAALPRAVVQAVAAALADAEPLADVELTITCDACGATWPRSLDIEAYLWRELDAWVNRLLAEVDELATAYGWSERDVLALSPRRRRRYLELIRRG